MKRSTFALFLILLAFGVYSVCRVGFYFKYEAYFSSLSGFEVFSAFIQGIRFDAAVLLLVMGPVALMIMLLSFKWWRTFWTAVGFVFIALSALYLLTDIYYFGFSSRHLVDEIRFLGNEKDFMLGTLVEYRVPGLLLLAGVIIAGVLVFRLSFKAVKSEKKLWVKVIILILASFVGIRGSFERKSLNTVDAYKDGVIAGNLALNGVYTTYRATGRSFAHISYYMDMDQAFIVLGLDSRAQYPLLKEFPGRDEKLNVIILLLESWDKQFINSYSDYAKEHDITPVFAGLAQDGALFTRHYSVEKRSLESIQSILTGIPPLSNLGRLGFGLEADSGGNMAEIATKNGYDSVFMQTSRRRSYYIDAISLALGFKQYYGMEDFSLILDYPDIAAAEFGWDYEGLARFGDAVEKSDKPVLGMFFSGTTHGPFAELPAPFNDYIGDKVDLPDLMHYSDYSIGEFMKKAAAQPWFKDTVFIITADHIGGVGYPVSYHIPMLIYSPGRIAPAVYDHVTSHQDILPTVLALSGMEGTSAVLGKNMFDSEGERFAFTTNKGLIGIVTDTVSLEVSDDMVVSSTFEGTRLIGKRFREAESYADAEEYRLLKILMAYIQVTDYLMSKNRWYPNVTVQ